MNRNTARPQKRGLAKNLCGALSLGAPPNRFATHCSQAIFKPHPSSFVATIVAAAVALFGCTGTKQKDPLAEQITAQHVTRREAGAEAYARYCALCHGRDATGYAADNAPSLISSTFLETASNDFLAKAIREGRPGTAMSGYGKGRGGPLDDDGIDAIITFLRDGNASATRLSSAPVLGDIERGEAIFEAKCQTCHGTQARRGTAIQLTNPTLLGTASDAFLRYAVVHGRPGTPMPAFGGMLTESEIDDVVAAVRSWASPAATARQGLPEPPLGPVVINPGAPHPNFTLRDGLYVAADDVKRALDEKKRIIIIDARAVPDWYSSHIPGSISVPYYLFNRLDDLPRDGTWITAYCACPHHASGTVIAELRKRGFQKTAILDEGILVWKQRGYPIEGETPPPGQAAMPNKSAPSFDTAPGLLRQPSAEEPFGPPWPPSRPSNMQPTLPRIPIALPRNVAAPHPRTDPPNVAAPHK